MSTCGTSDQHIASFFEVNIAHSIHQLIHNSLPTDLLELERVARLTECQCRAFV